ncbi:hypothetical protein T4A_8554 [Trichinella pseudospiralis]|uniref:Uncharacterized protein n=1 Tax=Trichinella pseudospiralis TaxID=6337 RepID=A0A0V1EHN0_TRIPS|nr:hypothetical protein T4A_8554 [Trichinella pseudospiralis]
MIAFYLSLEHTLHFAAHVQVVLRSCHLPRNESGKCSFVLSMQAVFIVATLLFDCGCICVVRCVTINEMKRVILSLLPLYGNKLMNCFPRAVVANAMMIKSKYNADFHFYVF